MSNQNMVHLLKNQPVLQRWLRPAAKPVSSPLEDQEAQLPESSNAHINIPSRKHTSQDDRLASSVVLQEAGVGWEETTQLLQGQISRYISRDDSDLSVRDLQSPSQPLSRSVSL